MLLCSSCPIYWRQGNANDLQDRIEYPWTLIGTNTGPEAPDTGSHQWLQGLADWSGSTHRLLAGPLR
jgi:hypothetical protein